MSNTGSSEENVKSPSTYGNDAYQKYRKKEKKKKKKPDLEKKGLNSYSKYAVGGESKEVPASAGLDENDNFIHRRKQNKPKQKKNIKK
jgi:hypothetical protein